MLVVTRVTDVKDATVLVLAVVAHVPAVLDLVLINVRINAILLVKEIAVQHVLVAVVVIVPMRDVEVIALEQIM